MNRRSFLGAMVAAPIAVPALAIAAPDMAMPTVVTVSNWSEVRLSGCYTADGALHYGRVYHTADIAALRAVEMRTVEPAVMPLTDGAGI